MLNNPGYGVRLLWSYRLNAINKVAGLSWSLMGERCLRCPGRMEIISCSGELPGSIYDQIFAVSPKLSAQFGDRVFADVRRIC